MDLRASISISEENLTGKKCVVSRATPGFLRSLHAREFGRREEKGDINGQKKLCSSGRSIFHFWERKYPSGGFELSGARNEWWSQLSTAPPAHWCSLWQCLTRGVM